MSTAIRVRNLGKRYQIGVAHNHLGTLREAVSEFAKRPLGRMRSNGDSAQEIWALKDISFEVQAGEVVGIVGANGAGKSTLLRVLSRITRPTTGEIKIWGRVGSMLEVGTGFHPELTGRENIYLNGAILGMSRKEINSRFDEIVDFSGIEKFLDTPVKKYSSGMYMRLAFAVAAHLETDILLIDEVLSVGDAVFQAKCLGKMDQVARGGRTVLYVSHNLGSLAALCPRAILLSGGKKIEEGPSAEVIDRYVSRITDMSGERVWLNPQEAPGNSTIRLRAVRVVSGGTPAAQVDIQREVQIEVDFWNFKPGARVMTSILLHDKLGMGVLSSANAHSANLVRDEWFNQPHPAGLYRSTCTLPGNFLNEGRYSISALVLTDVLNIEARADNTVSFTVHDTGGMRKEFGGTWMGVVRPRLAWESQRLEERSQAVS